MDKKLKILVIDDEPLIVKTTCMLLRHMGYEALEALGGASGLEIAKAENPGLILLDLVMPGLDGWNVLDLLKSSDATQHIPVVIFTAKDYANAETVDRFRGAVGHIRKPFDPEDLEGLMERLNLGVPPDHGG